MCIWITAFSVGLRTRPPSPGDTHERIRADCAACCCPDNPVLCSCEWGCNTRPKRHPWSLVSWALLLVFTGVGLGLLLGGAAEADHCTSAFDVCMERNEYRYCSPRQLACTKKSVVS